MDRNYVKNLLEELLNIYSPTGDTENAICFMEKKFKELNIPCRRTNKNALVATIEGEEKEAITFSGHVDTLGLVVFLQQVLKLKMYLSKLMTEN